MYKNEITLKKNYVYQGKILRIRCDDACIENGDAVKREVVEHNGGVCIVVLTPEDEVLLVRQFRYPYMHDVLEVPAGKLEIGEDPFLAAKREQLEETGTTAQDYVFLGDLYPSPGYTNEIIRMWACRADTIGTQHTDPDEFLELVKIPLAQAVNLVLENKLPDAKTQASILKTYMLVQEGKL